MKKMNLGIVGAGSIADFVCTKAQFAKHINLCAVASRRAHTASAFAEHHGIKQVYETWQQLCEAPSVDAVYIATPTHVKQEIAQYAARHGKHLLVDKPFLSAASVQCIIDEAKKYDVAFMDATHFSHHPRTQLIRETISEKIGKVVCVRSAFFAPLADKSNIRFDTSKEPTGALGDLAWYNMRALVEYVDPLPDVSSQQLAVRKEPHIQSLLGGSGVVYFDEGITASYDFGFDSTALLMDLCIVGEKGTLVVDDFLQDWHHSVDGGFNEHITGFQLKNSISTSHTALFIEASSTIPQCAIMLDNLYQLAYYASPTARQRVAMKALTTQKLLDAAYAVS